jgi:hypothetical protein
MEGSFACPECGTQVEVRGLAPGRQVRCGFCNRLLEVPYLPRAADSPWRRRRLGRPKWLPWVWAALAVLFVAILAAAGARFLNREWHSSQERSINQLVESSRQHQANGVFGPALIDLDAAIEMACRAGPHFITQLDAWRKERTSLAQRDAQTVIDSLCGARSAEFPLGNWLNLIARAKRDPDLATLRSSIDHHFQTALDREVDDDLAAARQGAETGHVVSSFGFCERIAAVLDHLAPSRQSTVRTETRDIVVRLVSTRGVKFEPPRGDFAYGSQTYVAKMLPVLNKALEAKGFLPYREASRWRHEWNHALYQLSLDVSEQLEGSYLSSANRLTRIEARLTLTSLGTSEWHWQTNPTARSTVPLPRLPAYLSSRLAMSRERSDEMERLLYDNARGQIHDKFVHALNNMPFCPTGQLTSSQ